MKDVVKSFDELEHTVTLESREKLTVSGVNDVGSYDEREIIVYTSMGQMTVRGENMKISKLNTDFGELIISGRIIGVVYTDERGRSGIFGKLMR